MFFLFEIEGGEKGGGSKRGCDSHISYMYQSTSMLPIQISWFSVTFILLNHALAPFHVKITIAKKNHCEIFSLKKCSLHFVTFKKRDLLVFGCCTSKFGITFCKKKRKKLRKKSSFEVFLMSMMRYMNFFPSEIYSFFSSSFFSSFSFSSLSPCKENRWIRIKKNLRWVLSSNLLFISFFFLSILLE